MMHAMREMPGHQVASLQGEHRKGRSLSCVLPIKEENDEF
jgi:hypothetical protein